MFLRSESGLANLSLMKQSQSEVEQFCSFGGGGGRYDE